MNESVKEVLTRLTGASHRGGAFSSSVLLAIAEVLPTGDLTTLETGCGKSTIMFSNLAEKHYVFAYDDRDSENSSVLLAQNDEQFREDHTIFVYGPTQQTLLDYVFPDEEMFDVILIDGPHGYPFPDLEYALLYDRLVVGGILILDDVHIPSIGRMYDILREDRMYEEVGVFATTGLLRRTALEGVPSDGDHWYEQSYNYSRFPLPMDKYRLNRTLPFKTAINIAEPVYLKHYVVKSIERAPGIFAARTIDIGASLKFDLPDTTESTLTIEIEYKSIYEGASKDAVVMVDGASAPLEYRNEWTILEMQVERPESGSLLLTFVHPHATPEQDIVSSSLDSVKERFNFRRPGSLLRSFRITNASSRQANEVGKVRDQNVVPLYDSEPGAIGSNQRKRVYYISNVHFWYRANGGMERDLRLISYLSRHFKVKMVYLGSLTLMDAQAIADTYLDLEILDLGTGQEFGPDDWIKRFKEKKDQTCDADVYLFRTLDCAYMLDALPEGAKTFLDSMDLISERSKKGSDQDNVLRKMTPEQEAKQFRRFDQVICVQEEESKLVGEWIGEENVITAKHPVNISRVDLERDRKRIGFIASKWAPNAYGLRDFIKNCWPTLRRRGATLDVYGNVVDVLKASVPAVTFHGYVDNLEECFARQGIFINPVQYGAGLKIKSIEAMANGLPLVTSREGASGIEHLDGTALLIAEDWAEFTDHLTALMEDEARCRELSENALRYLAENFNEEACFGELRRELAAV